MEALFPSLSTAFHGEMRGQLEAARREWQAEKDELQVQLAEKDKQLLELELRMEAEERKLVAQCASEGLFERLCLQRFLQHIATSGEVLLLQRQAAQLYPSRVARWQNTTTTTTTTRRTWASRSARRRHSSLTTCSSSSRQLRQAPLT